MKRDMDLVRTILLFVEKNLNGVHTVRLESSKVSEDHSLAEVQGHVRILVDGGYLEDVQQSHAQVGIGNLTNKGHDFLDSVRDPEIWKKTKIAGEEIGGWTFGILADYAKGLIKLQFDSLLSGGSS